jgi:kynureninase
MKKLQFENSLRFARKMDKEDPLRSFQNQFHFPKINGKRAVYLIGNSLGLQPKKTKPFVLEELEDWARLGGEGHVHARRPWMHYHKLSKKYLASIAGAKPGEVVAMNQLTVNLHLLMISFYNPTPERYKILTEAGAFSSDQYAFESQLRFHRISPEKGLIELKPREGEFILRTEDILSAIRQHASELALVIFGGVQYYTGQFFELDKITKAGHEAGAVVGFDLAHAIGNVPLKLHDDEVDFAVWCTYKYLNSGPGSIAGAFVHEKHGENFSLPRFAGWWGHIEEERFQMLKGFKPMAGVDGWQLSNVPVLQGAAHLAALSIFKEAGMKALCKKSVSLTGYLYELLTDMNPDEKFFTIITPDDPKQRGCQLSLYMKQNGKQVFSRLIKDQVVADWREPNVIRVAPTPLYNSFEDVFRFCEVFKNALA